MTATIYCIRHGQGYHNLGAGNYDLPDPKLTPFGEDQCKAVRDTIFSDKPEFALITASPLARTLHSASIIFEDSIHASAGPILALPDVQETSDDPCDTGSDLATLSKKCHKNGWTVNLSLLEDGWNDKALTGRYSPASIALEDRARSARNLLRFLARQLTGQGKQHINIALVTHGSFLHYFTGDWEGAGLYPATGWRNCEVRKYAFEDGLTSFESEARLIEVQDSRIARGLSHATLPPLKQRELYEDAMQAWEDQGLQNPSKI